MTKNFSKSEFESKCGREMPEEVYHNVVKVANQLQYLRDYLNKPIKVNSAYRSPEHNNSVSSTGLDGPHTTGIAVDIATNTQSQYKLLNFALNYEPKPTGIGIAKTFTHLDWLTPDVSQKYVVRPNVWKY